MKKLAVVLAGCAVLTSSTGCCWYPWYGYGYQGYGGCPGGNCQIAPGGPGGPGGLVIPPQGAMYGTPDAFQAAFPPASPPPIALQPTPAYPMTAMNPFASLPTY